MTTKNQTVKKVSIVSALSIGAYLLYLANRIKIKITNVDVASKTLDYKVHIGFKTFSGSINAYVPTDTKNVYKDKRLLIEVTKDFTVNLIVEKFKTTREILDQAQYRFNNTVFSPPQPEEDLVGETYLSAPQTKGWLRKGFRYDSRGQIVKAKR